MCILFVNHSDICPSVSYTNACLARDLFYEFNFHAVLTLTLTAVPTAPRDIVIKTPQRGMMQLSWKAPAEPNGIVTHYYVRWQPMKLASREIFDLRDYCGEY